MFSKKEVVPAKATELEARPRKPSDAKFDHELSVITAKDWGTEKFDVLEEAMSVARYPLTYPPVYEIESVALG